MSEHTLSESIRELRESLIEAEGEEVLPGIGILLTVPIMQLQFMEKQAHELELSQGDK